MRAALHVPVPEARKNCDRAATAAPVVVAEGDRLTGALTVGQIAPSADYALAVDDRFGVVDERRTALICAPPQAQHRAVVAYRIRRLGVRSLCWRYRQVSVRPVDAVDWAVTG